MQEVRHLAAAEVGVMKDPHEDFWATVEGLYTHPMPNMFALLALRRQKLSNAEIAKALEVEPETIRLLVDFAWWLESERKVWRDFEAKGQRQDRQWWQRFRDGWVATLSDPIPDVTA